MMLQGTAFIFEEEFVTVTQLTVTNMSGYSKPPLSRLSFNDPSSRLTWFS